MRIDVHQRVFRNQNRRRTDKRSSRCYLVYILPRWINENLLVRMRKSMRRNMGASSNCTGSNTRSDSCFWEAWFSLLSPYCSCFCTRADLRILDKGIQDHHSIESQPYSPRSNKLAH